jgi:hypothetical protein
MNDEQTTLPPVAEVRFGNIRAAIWRNLGATGPWYNVTFERSYTVGGEYRTAHNFGRDDLLTVAKVADIAHSEIFDLQRADREEPILGTDEYEDGEDK